jgi:hypothetical protein
MESEDTGKVQLELEYDQDLFMVIGGEGKDAKMLTEDDNLVVFESLWHAGPLVHDLQTLGITARMVTMPLEGLYCLAEGMDLGLWVLRHDGTVTSVDEIIFPE